MQKLDMVTPYNNYTSNVEKLEQIFPSCITEFIDKEGKLRKNLVHQMI